MAAAVLPAVELLLVQEVAKGNGGELPAEASVVHQKIKEVNDVSGNGVQVISEMSMEIEGQERPAMVAEFISLSFA